MPTLFSPLPNLISATAFPLPCILWLLLLARSLNPHNHTPLAPDNGAKASKGKAAAVEMEQTVAGNRQTRAFFRWSIVNNEMVGKLRWQVAGSWNENGATALKPMSA